MIIYLSTHDINLNDMPVSIKKLYENSIFNLTYDHSTNETKRNSKRIKYFLEKYLPEELI